MRVNDHCPLLLNGIDMNEISIALSHTLIHTKLYLAPNTLGIDSLEIPKFLSINCVKLLHTKPYLTWNFSQRGTLAERISHIVKHKPQKLPWSTTCSLAGI